jgi:hypothetical protein
MVKNHRLRLLAVIPFLILAVTLCITATAAPTSQNRDAAPTGPQSAPEDCFSEVFYDVCPADWHYPHVMALYNLGAIGGYSDNTFRPGNNITRGQVMKIVVTAYDLTAPMPTYATFHDVTVGSTFFNWVEVGAAHNIASGYACGGPGEPCDTQNRPYFRPHANVTRGQLAKMLTNALDWPTMSPPTPSFRDVPANSPFYGYVERVAYEQIVSGYNCGGATDPCPGRYFHSGSTSTRAQAAKMIDLGLQRRPTRTPRPTSSGTPPTSTRTRTPLPTYTPTRVPTNTPTHVAGGPCQVFPADNIWNRNIAALPTHALSNAYMNSIGLDTNVHADFGSGLWDGGPIGIPFVNVTAAQPDVPINLGIYADESDPGPYPVPTNAPIEGGPGSDGDRHVLVIDQGDCTLYEMGRAFPQSNGSWDADGGAKFNLNSHALRPDTWTSADAAGLPIYPGLVRYEEVAAGFIGHAVRFTAEETQQAYLWPARHYASSSTDPNLPPMGLRVRLKAGVNISGFSPQVRVILQALKDYGMFLADNGSSWYISGAPDERWDNDMLHEMDVLTGRDFEAVDESGLMVNSNSGQSR